MKFCNICDNLLHLSLCSDTEQKDEQLHYFCKCCKSKVKCGSDFDPCIYKKNYGRNENVFYEMFVNKYTKYDPTLPHVYSMPCANKSCAEETKKKKEKSDILFMRYNEDQMKYIYMCCKCDKAWINPEYDTTNFIDYES